MGVGDKEETMNQNKPFANEAIVKLGCYVYRFNTYYEEP